MASRSVDDLRRAVLHTPTGQSVQLGDIATINARLGPTRIEHTDLDRSLKLSVGMILSTLFTLMLVPAVLSLVLPARAAEGALSSIIAGS